MSVNIGGKVYRNLQEQVGYLTEQLENLKNYVDGLELKDKLVVIENTSGTLSDKEMEVVLMPLCFMATADELFVKSESNASEVIFKKVDLKVDEVSATYYTIGGKKITVDIATQSYNTSSETKISVYSKDQMDTLLSAKANISGANFTGPITATSIIEDMSGYSVTQMGDPTVVENTISYVGAVKNGNKITFVFFGSLKKLQAVTETILIRFNIPSAVGQKLYPYSLGGYDCLQNSKSFAFTGLSAGVDIYNFVVKRSNTVIDLISNIYNLVIGSTYYIRFEATFLLSDSLAS